LIVPYQRKAFKVLYAVDADAVFEEEKKGVARVLFPKLPRLLVFIIGYLLLIILWFFQGI